MKIRIGILLAVWLLMYSCTGDGTTVEGSNVVIPKDGKTELKTGGIMTPDGVLLNYLVAGEGRKTLIIPNAVYLADDFRVLSSEYRLIFYDLRNRGRSQAVNKAEKLSDGILNDVKDLEAIRKHFELEKFSVIGHSYLGMMVALYARQYPGYLEKVVQIAPIPPVSSTNYSNNDVYSDSLSLKTATSLQNLESQKADLSSQAYCDKWWGLMRLNYVGNGTGAERVARGICRYPNEHPDKMLNYFKDYIQPSIEKINLAKADLQDIKTPFLIIHGTKDRIIPIGSSRDWATLLPEAKLVEIENGGHLPWIEAEAKVFDAIRDFLQ